MSYIYIVLIKKKDIRVCKWIHNVKVNNFLWSANDVMNNKMALEGGFPTP